MPEAMDLLHDWQSRGEPFVFMGGGTDLLVDMKQRQVTPGHVMSLSGLPELHGIEKTQGALKIGAAVTLAELCENALLRTHAPSLASAAALVASPQIRQAATVGGNLLLDNRCQYYNQSQHNRALHGPCFKADGEACHLVKSAGRDSTPVCRARCCSDLTAVALLLHARLHFSGPAGRREVRLAGLHSGEGLAPYAREAGEILTHIEIPLPAPAAMSYRKLRIRNTLDFPSLGVAASLQSTAQGAELGVALVGIGTRPGLFRYRAQDFPRHSDLCARACADAGAAAVVYADGVFPRGYRKQMIAVFIGRALADVQGNTGAQS